MWVVERHPRIHKIFFGKAVYGRAAAQYQSPRKRPQNAHYFYILVRDPPGVQYMHLGAHTHAHRTQPDYVCLAPPPCLW